MTLYSDYTHFFKRFIMLKWILVFCLPLASFAEVSVCSKKIANLILVEPMLVERPRKPAGQPIFTKGLDEANRMIQLAERLRNSQIDPYTTHIPEFADDIPKHISWIKEGIEKSGEKKEAQLKALAELEKEVLEKAKNKQVTYEWWLIWNENLINLASGFINRVTKFIDYFPKAILLPTISEVGITAMNRYFSQRVFPLGLVNQPTFADGNLLSPADFFDHDIAHTEEEVLLYYYTSISDIDKHFNINLYQEFMKLDLTPEQQEMIDLVYFSIVHEGIMHIDLKHDWQESKDIPFNIIHNTTINRFQTKGNLREFLSTSVNADSKEEVEAYLNESTQLFEQLLHQILKAAAARNK